MTNRHAVALFAALVLSSGTRLEAQATTTSQQRPDFVGKWVMDTTRSNRDGVLKSLTLTVTRTGDVLSVLSEGVNAGGQFTSAGKYSLDGRPSSNPLGAVTLESTVSWEGATLVLKSTGEANGRAITVTDRWTLDPSGKILTRQSSLALDSHSRSETLVLTRQ